jgi:hypothetical protein
MATLLEHGGKIELGGGWSTALPPSYYEQNPDGSWASWGTDWALDVQVIEVAGDSNGHPVLAEKMLGPDRTANSSGYGWIGEVLVLTEEDSGRMVYRLAATLAANNTLCSFWVSYFDESQRPFAEKLVQGVAHGG